MLQHASRPLLHCRLHPTPRAHHVRQWGRHLYRFWKTHPARLPPAVADPSRRQGAEVLA
jgi:hypothetical protein